MTQPKPLFIYLMLLFVAIAPAWSQPPRWSLNLKVGGGLTGEWTDRDPRFLIPGGQIIERLSPRAGILFGMQLRYQFAEHWAVVTGLEYQTMNDHLYREGRTLEWELYKRTVSYSACRLQVPLQIRYAFTARPKSVYMQAGAMATHMLYLNTHFPDWRDFEIDLYAPLNETYRNQVPLLLTVGVPIGKRWAIEATYQYVREILIFDRYNIGSLTIGLQPEESHLNKGAFVSVLYGLKRR